MENATEPIELSDDLICALVLSPASEEYYIPESNSIFEYYWYSENYTDFSVQYLAFDVSLHTPAAVQRELCNHAHRY